VTGQAKSPPTSALAVGLFKTMRPKQWVKNLLVLAAPAAAGDLFDPPVLLRASVAFVCFCLAASGTYLLNDALDVEADRLHPKKRRRPIAAGVVPVLTAKVTAICLLVLSLVLALPVRDGQLALVVAVYVALTLSYSLWLKRSPVIELACVAAGFVLRAIAGGVATGVPLSDWFLIVASFGALGIVADKRFAELRDLEENSTSHRAVLEHYSAPFLNHVRALAAGVASTAYCLWAFEKAAASDAGLAFRLSIIPFVLALLRYALRTEQGAGGAPEELLSDHTLQVLGALFCMLFAVGVYLG
jgi:decaprenyl-phosphate phosphoribosyltransferase